MSTLETTRGAMTDELATALSERDMVRVEAAARWLLTTGSALVDVYETLLSAATQEVPPYPQSAAEHVRSWELQEDVRALLARLAPRRGGARAGQVVLLVPGGSRWVFGPGPLAHLLDDAGFAAVASPELGLDDLEPTLESLDDPVAVCLALHDVALVPRAREVVRRVRQRWPRVCVIVGGRAHAQLPELGSLVGAHAVTTSLSQTLDVVRSSTNPLSPREVAVLALVAKGMSNPDAGQHLGVAPATVKTHLDRVYAKLGTSDRTATVALAMRRGWIA